MHIPVAGGNVSQRWGYTGLASNGPYYDNRFSPAKYYPIGFHTGIDLAAPQGTRVRNMEHGVVHIAAWNACDPNDGCWGFGGGYVVIVKHNGTPVYTSHAHMMRLLVRPGQPVYRGQPLGILDTAGNATGPHDHCSLWVRGLWWSQNHAYTLDPWSAIYGSLRTNPLLNPATVRVPLNVHLRTGPGLRYRAIGLHRKRVLLPVFKNRVAGAVPGYSSRLWRLVWYGRWAWVFAPLTEMVRGDAITDDALEAAGAIPLDEVGYGVPPGEVDQELVTQAPSPDAHAHDRQPLANLMQPDAVAFRSASESWQWAELDNAF